MEQERRGILYPERLPEFHRVPPPPALAHAVRWFWIPEWDLPEGAESRQEVLPFPACNVVVEPDGISAVGPTTRSSERVLVGRGWAVGALLLPAAVGAVVPDPASLRDAARPLAEPTLHGVIRSAMGDLRRPGATRRAIAVGALADWLRELVAVPDPGSEAALANRLAELLADPALTRVDQLPDLLHVSIRTLQRIADRSFGLSLHAMIRRRRLQEGAERLREDPALTLAALAADLGYADHAHFTRDFTAQLGVTPSRYRERALRSELR
ncbi:helix-turn-helix domain-containing protein [Leucobacter rhizosphaerae]|uniref:Helix-turn-helix domain-containing protein n=1 Tax=Leucobacter rhizosphaerae TaxID=2932245 RepID=A0ABY4FRT7_9MICO|nr:helix-turn-helix domain-containing protein [Leucobacter rhizosphaerae]UOQ58977.1 helix-turn-helix domain-containing protein [Leucobacter rhizosphaerae]